MKRKNISKENIIDENGVMALSYGTLNLADYLTTRRILNTGGEELNPVADFLIRKKCFGVFKIASILAGMTLIYFEEKPKIAGKVMLGLYGVVVAHNLKEIIQHEKEIKRQESAK